MSYGCRHEINFFLLIGLQIIKDTNVLLGVVVLCLFFVFVVVLFCFLFVF